MPGKTVKPTALAAPKGVPDYFPPTSRAFIAVRDTLIRAADRAGYSPIELPVFEDTALFARGVGRVDRRGRPRRCTPSPTAAAAR